MTKKTSARAEAALMEVKSAPLRHEFLTQLAATGKITVALKLSGYDKREAHLLRASDRAFASDWETSINEWSENIDHELMLTARALGIGKWVTVMDEVTGKPLLDDDFEEVTRFSVDDVDPKVLIKLLALRMPSVEGPNQVNVQVNNAAPVPSAVSALRRLPALVYPTGAEVIKEVK